MRTTEKENIISDRNVRDNCVSHYEVLEKVKKVLLIPDTEWATQKQVAEYYEVGEKAIETICTRHKDELETDGVSLKSYKEFLNIQNEGLETVVGKTIFLLANGESLTVPNRGLKVFPRRAILRVGMLLRDSAIAKEVRTQLLNIEEKVSDEVKTYDINEEQSLMLAVGMAVASGDANAVAIATTNLVAFKNRHIEKLKVDNAKLENDNKALAGNILEWSDRKSMSAGIRMLKSVTGQSYSDLWNELYRNLQYKYGICLKQRGKSPFIQHVREDEWDKVLKTFSAMCEAYGQSPTDMIKRTVMNN